MSGDVCKIKNIEVVVQENGIIRDMNGLLIGRLTDDIDYQSIKRYTNPNESFEVELTHLINKHSMESVCNMPDFLMAKMIVNLLAQIGTSMKANLDWHGCHSIYHTKDTQ